MANEYRVSGLKAAKVKVMVDDGQMIEIYSCL